jgi:hypothetical protein
MAETERTGLLRRILGGQSERTGPGLGGYGYNNAEGSRVGALRDMFDGGGRGQSGPRFEGGGMFSAAANAVARPSGSRERGEPDMRTGVGGFARDMIDGGGLGQSGPTFQGGMYGGLLGSILNNAGVRPMGYMERLGSVAPQMRPPMPTSPAAAVYTAPTQPAAPAGMPAYTPPSAMEMPINYATANPYALALLANRGVDEAAEEFRRRYSGDVVPEGAGTFREYLGNDATIAYMRDQGWTPDFVRGAYEDYLAGFARQ